MAIYSFGGSKKAAASAERACAQTIKAMVESERSRARNACFREIMLIHSVLMCMFAAKKRVLSCAQTILYALFEARKRVQFRFFALKLRDSGFWNPCFRGVQIRDTGKFGKKIDEVRSAVSADDTGC